MEEIGLEKKVSFELPVKGIKNILIRDQLKYHKLESGIKIEGKILIDGIAILEEQEKSFQESLDVDIFISLLRIDSLDDIKLKIDGYTYRIDDSSVIFDLKARVEGENYDIITFEPSETTAINKAIIDSLLLESNFNPLLRENIDEDFINQVNEIINQKDVEMISSFNDENLINDPDDIIEISESEPIPYVEVKEEIKLEEPKKEVKSLEKETKIESLKKEAKSTSSTSGLKQNYVASFVFYKIKPNESLSDIAQRFNISEDEIRRINSKKKLNPGELIELPKR